MRHNCFYQPILVALMTLWSFAAHSQIVINYQAPDSTQVTYEDSQFDITKKAGSYEFNGLDISKVNYITRFKTANTKEGHVTLPEGAPINVSSLLVLGGQSKVRVDKNGNFSIPGNNLMVVDGEDRIVFKALVSLNQEDNTLGIDINATETALALLLPVISNLTANLSNESLYTIKNLLAQLPEADDLAKAVEKSIVKHGYLDMSEVNDEYAYAVKIILQKVGMTGGEGNTNMVRKWFENFKNEITQKDDYRVHVYDMVSGERPVHDDLLKIDGEINCVQGNFKIWNSGCFSYKVVTVCRKVSDDWVSVVDKRPSEFFKYVLPPLRVSSFMDKITSLEGVANSIADAKKILDNYKEGKTWFEDLNSGFPYLSPVLLNFVTKDDGIGIIGPNDDMKVMCYNWYHGLMGSLLHDIVTIAISDEVMGTAIINAAFDEMLSDDEFWTSYVDIMSKKTVDKVALFNLFYDQMRKGKIAAFKEAGKQIVMFNSTFDNILKNYNSYLKAIEATGDVIMGALGLTEGSYFYEFPYGDFDNLPTADELKEKINNTQPTYLKTVFRVMAEKEGNGSVSATLNGLPANTLSFDYKEEDDLCVEYKATPDDGYVLGSWLINESIVGTDNTYTFRHAQGASCTDTKIVAYFRKLEQVTTNFSAGLHGSITAKRVGSDSPVESGVTLLPDNAEIIYTAHPDKGYKVSKWVQNGLDWATDRLQYNSGIVRGQLTVEFEEDPDYDYTKDPDYNPVGNGHLQLKSKLNNGQIPYKSYGIVEITSGSGLYKAVSSDPYAFLVEVKGSQVIIHAERSGPATITVTDYATGETQKIDVNSSKEALLVSDTSLEIYEGETVQVDILHGSGSYQLANSGNQYAKVEIISNSIRIEGLKKGKATVTLKDVYQSETVKIDIDVKESNINLGSNYVKMFPGTEMTVIISRGDYTVTSSEESIVQAYYVDDSFSLPHILLESSTELGDAIVYIMDNKTHARMTIKVNVSAKDGDVFSYKSVEGHDLLYRVISVKDKTCEAVGGDRDFGWASGWTELTIPDYANEYKVVSLADYIFYLSDLETVHLPNTLIKIGTCAFEYCQNLRSINFPESLKEIGSSAFVSAHFQSIDLPNSLEIIGSYAFANCENLKEVRLPNSLKSISPWIFARTGLTSITIPESVTYIGQYAFTNCKKLTSAKLPSSLKTIGDYAFIECSNLSSIEFPASLESIGFMAFEKCSSLTSITIPNSVKSIANYAFGGCKNLKVVYSLMEEPCGIGSPFSDTPEEKMLYVPLGTRYLYMNTGGWKWNSFKPDNIIQKSGDKPYPLIIDKDKVSCSWSESWNSDELYLKKVTITSGSGLYEVSEDEIADMRINEGKDYTILIHPYGGDENKKFSDITVTDVYSKEKKTFRLIYAPDLCLEKELITMAVDSIYEISPIGSDFYVATSSNTSVATVEVNGKKIIVKGVSIGESIVTVTDEGIVQKAEVKVKVYPHLEFENYNIVIKDTADVQIVPKNGSGVYSSWTGNENIAWCCDFNRPDINIYPRGVGETKVYVRDELTGEQDSLNVKVMSEAFKAIQLEANEAVIIVGETASIRVLYSSGSLSVKSNDETIAKGKEVYWGGYPYVDIEGVGVGTTTVTITDETSLQKWHIKVYVCDPVKNLIVDMGQKIRTTLNGSGSYTATGSEFFTVSFDGNEMIVTGVNFGEDDLVVIDQNTGIKILFHVTVVAVDPEELKSGDFFTATTIDGAEVSYMVLSVEDKTCNVCSPNNEHNVIDYGYSGKVTIPEEVNGYKVTGISGMAFYGCRLTDIEIPNTVTWIGTEAFVGCEGIKTMVIPNSVETIAEGAFRDCSNLEYIVLSKNLSSIGSDIFLRCDKLKTIVSLAETPISFTLTRMGDGDPYSQFDKTTLYVPKGTQNIYKTTEGWNHFKNIVEFDGDYPSYETYPDLQLYKYNVEEAVSTTECMGIVSGSGSYQVESSNDNIAEAKLNWQLVCILAKAPGTATITVTDLKTGQVKTIYVKVHDGQSGQDEIWKSKIADLTYERDKLEKELKEKATEEEAPELYAMLRDINSYISAMDSDWRNGKFASLEKYETDIKQRLEQLKKAIDALGK